MGNSNSGRRPGKTGIHSWRTRALLLKAMMETGEVQVALDRHKVPATSYYRYCQRNPGFAAKAAEALALGQGPRTAKLRKVALLGATEGFPEVHIRPPEYMRAHDGASQIRTHEEAIAFARQSPNILDYTPGKPDKTLLIFLLKQADPSFRDNGGVQADPNFAVLVEEVVKLAKERKVAGIDAIPPDALKQAIVMAMVALRERQTPTKVIEAE